MAFGFTDQIHCVFAGGKTLATYNKMVPAAKEEFQKLFDKESRIEVKVQGLSFYLTVEEAFTVYQFRNGGENFLFSHFTDKSEVEDGRHKGKTPCAKIAIQDDGKSNVIIAVRHGYAVAKKSGNMLQEEAETFSVEKQAFIIVTRGEYKYLLWRTRASVEASIQYFSFSMGKYAEGREEYAQTREKEEEELALPYDVEPASSVKTPSPVPQPVSQNRSPVPTATAAAGKYYAPVSPAAPQREVKRITFVVQGQPLYNEDGSCAAQIEIKGAKGKLFPVHIENPPDEIHGEIRGEVFQGKNALCVRCF